MRSYLKLSLRKEECVMKRSKLIAVLLVSVMVIVAVQPAFAAKKSDWKDGAVQTIDAANDLIDVYEVGKEVVNGNYGGAGKVVVKSVVNDVVVKPVVTTVSTSAITALGLTGVVASGGTLLIGMGAAYCVSSFIDWIW